MSVLRHFLLVAVVILAACKAKEDAFYAKIWPCNPSLPDTQCGTAQSGVPMKCFAGSRLGGQDYCVESCDPSQNVSDAGAFVCLSDGLKLPWCDPTVVSSCPEGYQCFSTSLDIRTYSGLCIRMPVCTYSSECSDAGQRSQCAGELVRQRFPSPYIYTGHLQCVQRCDADAGNSCASGQTCLGTYYVADPSIPDVCVPSCDTGQPPCPPNFYCLANAGKAYPNICTPGLPGRRCAHDEDCMVGRCVDTDAGFSVCAVDCASDGFCTILDGSLGLFFCAQVGDAGTGGHCFTRSPFSGQFCYKNSDCTEVSNSVCSAFNPFDPSHPRPLQSLECHGLCSGPGTCARRGPIPYVCLPADNNRSECYPGDFGIPCAPGLEQCIGQLQCLSATPDAGTDGATQNTAICTRPCNNDKACTSYSLTSNGYCKDGICNPPQAQSKPCNNSQQCVSGNCGTDGTCQ